MNLYWKFKANHVVISVVNGTPSHHNSDLKINFIYKYFCIDYLTGWLTFGYSLSIGKVTASVKISPLLMGHVIPSSQPLSFGK